MENYNKTKQSYTNYISSKEWNKKRIKIAELRNYTCEKCKKVVKSGFHIHHKTYKHFKHEQDNELMFLCEECHNKLHYKQNIKSNKKKKNKLVLCPYCLNRFSRERYIENYVNKCPKCSRYIGRPNKYGKLSCDYYKKYI